jgi:hypothetical protein
MGKWIIVTESTCNDPSRESEFQDWYKNVHFPDVLDTPGIVRTTRYELMQPDGDRSKYINIFEIEADDIESVMKQHQENMSNKVKQGRMSSLLVRKWRGVYTQVISLPGRPSA